jgi:phage tail sheath gpL-like
MAKLVLEIETDDSATQMVSRLDSAVKDDVLPNIVNLLSGIQGGAYNAALNMKLGAVQATLSGTFTGAPTAAETCTINGVAFTARASGAVGNEFNIGGTVTITAANLAAAINASVTAGVADVVFASSALGVVTLSSKQAGKVGNAIIVADALSNFTWAGAATRFASGAQSTNRTFQYSKVPTTSY